MELYQKIMSYAVRLLSRRRYAVNELKKKLLQKFGSEEMTPETRSAIEKTIARLVELKYLNDDEFVALFIRDQLLRKAQGARVIAQKLKQKGIDAEIINKTIATHWNGKGELEQAVIAARKKGSSLNREAQPSRNQESRQKNKEKIFRFLAARGFSQGTALKALKELGY